MAGLEIRSTICVSRQPSLQNIYLTTYRNENFFFQKKGILQKNISDYLGLKHFCSKFCNNKFVSIDHFTLNAHFVFLPL